MENLSQESVNNYENCRRSMENPCEPETTRQLFIGGLHYRTTKDSLQSYFEKYGTVVKVIVMTDPNTKRSRGFGFVTFSTSSMADHAQASRPHSIDGRVVDSKRAVPRDEGDRSKATVKKVYISGIDEDHENDDLRQYFRQFGNVTHVNIKCDTESGKRRGFAFVEFDDNDPVDKVVLQKEHNVKGKTLNVKKAIPKLYMDRGNSSRSSCGGRNTRQGGNGQSLLGMDQNGKDGMAMDRNGGMNQGVNAYNNGYGENNHGSNWSNGCENGSNWIVNCTNGWNNVWNGNINGLPGNSIEWTGNINVLPGNINGLPGNINGLPDNNNRLTGNINGLPGNINTLPGNINGLPGNNNGLTGNINGLPGNINVLPSNSIKWTGNNNGLTGNINGLTGNINVLPGNSIKWTGNNNGLTGNNNGLTGNINGLPGNINVLPSNSIEWTGNNNGLTGNINGLTGNINGLTGINSFRNFGNIYQAGFYSGAIRNNFTGNNRMNPYGNGNFGADGRHNFNQGNVVREGRRGF